MRNLSWIFNTDPFFSPSLLVINLQSQPHLSTLTPPTSIAEPTQRTELHFGLKCAKTTNEAHISRPQSVFKAASHKIKPKEDLTGFYSPERYKKSKHSNSDKLLLVVVVMGALKALIYELFIAPDTLRQSPLVMTYCAHA